MLAKTKNRTINRVRTNKIKKSLRRQLSCAKLYERHIVLKGKIYGWDSNVKGTYVKAVHGKLK